jgi:tetratricopeptide (TPR) repeat protein
MEATHPYPARPLKVLHLKGTDYEMGRQHAELLGDCVSQGMPSFYYRFWNRIIEAPGAKGFQAEIKRLGGKLLDKVLVRKLQKQVSPFLCERIRGMSDVSGVAEKEFLTALVLPDLLPMLQAYAGKWGLFGLVDVVPPVRLGCTSFLGQGAAGELLQGRNLDFPGVAYWDRYPVIQLIERKGSLRYIGFASAGVPIAGITGINEAQISVALHQHYGLETSLTGRLPFIIGEEILCRAKTLEEARDIISRSNVSSAWAFVVGDGKTKSGFICETHPRAKGFRELLPASVLAHSNIFQTDDCRPSEYATTSRMNWDNHCRRERLHELVQKAGANLTAKEAVSFVCDHFDPYWLEEKPFNRTISQVYNIQSLVWDLTNMKCWMAEGNAPIHLDRYVEYDLGKIFEGKTAATGNTRPGFRFQESGNEEAKRSYILSFVRAFDGDFNGALEFLKKSLEAKFWPEAGLVAALLYMKQGDLQQSLEYLEKSRQWIEKKMQEKGFTQHPPEYFEIRLFHARALDLLGRRDEAKREYETLAREEACEDPNVKKKARASTYKRERLDRILMPYSSYIPFD